MMIKRRLFACYVFFGLGALLFLFSLNSMYAERYELPSESRVRQQFQVPDPFPQGKPDFRKKHEEELRKKAEEKFMKQEEAKKKEAAEIKRKLESKKDDDDAAALVAQLEAQAKESSKEGETKSESKKSQSDTGSQSTEGESALSSAATALLIEEEAELTPEELSEPVSQLALSRKKRYASWMKAFNSLPEHQKRLVSGKLQTRFLGMAQEEVVEDLTFPEAEKVDGKVQPAGAKILILTAGGQDAAEGSDILAKARENRAEYAAYHGYVEYFVNMTKYAEPANHPVLSKIKAIKEAFDENPEVEWVWWADTSIIIMNPEIDIAEHVLSKHALTERLTYGRPLRNAESLFFNGAYMKKGEVDIDNLDIVMCQDIVGFNTGSFFLRRSAFTSMLLNLLDDPLVIPNNAMTDEHDPLIQMFLFHDFIQPHVGLLPQRLLNAYQGKTEYIWSYSEGDFVINFPGCINGDKCDENWEINWEKRGRVPVTYQVKDTKPVATSAGTAAAAAAVAERKFRS